jgi:Na+-transporting methylmalonyl-CoA/oxaloacetate decarboxylase gamma subunit
MNTGRMIELAAAVIILGLGIWLYRRPKGADGYGSQGAVLLFVVALIMAIHALGGLDYHPTNAEAEYFKDHKR